MDSMSATPMVEFLVVNWVDGKDVGMAEQMAAKMVVKKDHY